MFSKYHVKILMKFIPPPLKLPIKGISLKQNPALLLVSILEIKKGFHPKLELSGSVFGKVLRF